MTSFYFLGIGGTAMGSVAAALHKTGYSVTGSDMNVYSPMSDFLAEQGIQYHEGWDTQQVKQGFHGAPPDYIVVGNAISRGNPELEYALNNRLPLISMSDVVSKFLIQQHTSVVISGTHGKTTTSSITSWLLNQGNQPLGFLIGGIVRNFGVGCRPVPQTSSETQGIFVSEGDEYDTAFFDKRSKFLLYRPDIAVINNIEFDHADIFSSIDDILRSFRLFVRLIPQNGHLLVASNDNYCHRMAKEAFCTVESFGIEDSATWRATDIDYSSTGTQFTLLHKGKEKKRIHSPLSGEHNVRNVLAAIAVGQRCSVSMELLQQGLRSFIPPKRRMEVLSETPSMTVIDDFAHHPTAIRETLRAIKQKYPNRRIIACFEPRSNTTTRNIFQKELSKCFVDANVVILGAVNRPDRYAPKERLDIPLLIKSLEQYTPEQVILQTKRNDTNWGEEVLTHIQSVHQLGDVICLLSNGNFGGLREKLTQ
jgi:UDP-N-acetylmuramate: L-alanyl-gamma-D-glutamyl-meso-diaminopimelate ligase